VRSRDPSTEAVCPDRLIELIDGLISEGVPVDLRIGPRVRNRQKSSTDFECPGGFGLPRLRAAVSVSGKCA